MIIKIDVLPQVEATGSSDRHGGERNYYFLAEPQVQFVLWGTAWDNLKVGDYFDANTGVTQYRGTTSKITLRSKVTPVHGATPLSELIDSAAQTRDVQPVIVYFKDNERAVLDALCAKEGLTQAQVIRRMVLEAGKASEV